MTVHLSVPVRAIIFDVDGTLVTDDLHREKHNQLLKKIFSNPAPTVMQKEWQEIRGWSDQDAYGYILKKIKVTGFDGDLLPDAVTYLAAANDFLRANITRIQMRAGVPEIITACHKRRLARGIATNASQDETSAKLSAVLLASHFSFHSCLDDVLRPKPFPDLYEDAINKARLFVGEKIQPRQVLVLEDTPTGVKAALDAGCRVIYWPDADDAATLASPHPNLFTARHHQEVVATIVALSAPLVQAVISLRL